MASRVRRLIAIEESCEALDMRGLLHYRRAKLPPARAVAGAYATMLG
jgi:hypothetical protein